jgi:hypothetical protein
MAKEAGDSNASRRAGAVEQMLRVINVAIPSDRYSDRKCLRPFSFRFQPVGSMVSSFITNKTITVISTVFM